MNRKIQVFLLLISAIFGISQADVYLHNPRGSNNRNRENTRERNNANRLFDSQNNARGGYNVGSLYYFVDSELGIEWTNQHSCGDGNNFCEIIIQYMCSDLLRDGITQSTIPENPAQCEKNDCNTDSEYGMHEDFYYYAHCKLRTRNKNLFTADQNLKGESAKYTRQNPAGTRRGYECPEERDYYPYWGPTPWKDIAVLTNDVKRCEHYQSESQNVKSKMACEVPYQYLYKKINKKVEKYIPISKEKCEAFDAEAVKGQPSVAGIWKEYPSHKLPPPSCGNTIPSRDNHLGNTVGGHPATFNWTIFDDPHKSCAIRIRYNISTADFDGWNTSAKYNNRLTGQQGYGPDIWTPLGLTKEQAKTRQYYLKNNPQVDVFNGKFKLQLAINTAQFARTFQDRTHRMTLRSRPKELKDVKIRNLNVRGKRGNIVQVYPGVEYDFVPNTLRASPGEYVHIQWTGSNDNPKNNNGQGEAGTDRSNMVLLKKKTFAEGNPALAEKRFGNAGRSYPSIVDRFEFAGFDAVTRSHLATLHNFQLGGKMELLDDAGTYYDLGPKKITMTGDYNYMCTRNNNFSNRSQKGKIVVKKSQVQNEYIGELGGNITITGTENGGQTGATFPPASLQSATKVQLEVLDNEEVPLKTLPPNDKIISNFVHLSDNAKASEKNPITMTIALKSGSNIGTLYEPTVYRTTDDKAWIVLPLMGDKTTSSAVHFKTDEGGYFVVTRTVSAGPLAGIVIGCFVALILIIVVAIYCKTSKLPLASYSSKV